MIRVSHLHQSAAISDKQLRVISRIVKEHLVEYVRPGPDPVYTIHLGRGRLVTNGLDHVRRQIVESHPVHGAAGCSLNRVRAGAYRHLTIRSKHTPVRRDVKQPRQDAQDS